MSETCIAQGLAQVMIYNNPDKQWESAPGSDGSATTVQLLQNRSRLGFRIISRRADNAIILNSNLFQKLKYRVTNSFYQWRDEEKRVLGLNFRYDQEGQVFMDLVKQAVEQLDMAMNNGMNDYQHAADNVYQDPHQHLMHIHSAPNFHHDENQNANFRKTSQHASTLYSASAMTQQQRRASQTSSTSAGSAPPMAPPISNIPQAPPPPPVAGIAPVNTSAAPPPPPLPPVGAGAPPPPPPPPPPAALMASNGAAPTLLDQIKQRTAQKNAGGIKPNGVPAVEEKPAAPKPTGDLFSEMNALFNKRKNTQAKSDAVDSKSNTSNGSSDSGCGIGTNGSNGGSVGSAAAKKWSVPDGPKPTDSPKTHRKLPSASSLFSQEDSSTKPGPSTTNGTPSVPSNGTATGVSNEQLERLRADLMVEVRLEMNKLRQDLMEAQERSKQEILEAIVNAIGRR